MNQTIKCELRPWQTGLIELLNSPDLPTHCVIWVQGERGGEGKSYMTKLLGSLMQCQILRDGRTTDLIYALDPSKKFFIFDLPRYLPHGINYDLYSAMMTGVVKNTKYGIKDIHLKVARVIIFSSAPPDDSKINCHRFIKIKN